MRILIDTNILFSNDCPILRAAIAANCDVILTGDKDLLEADLLRPLLFQPPSSSKNDACKNPATFAAGFDCSCQTRTDDTARLRVVFAPSKQVGVRPGAREKED